MGSGGFIDSFRDLRRPTRVLIGAMLVLGVALFVVCLVADLQGAVWIKTHAYIPNILAGLTGFLIGVPFALVVLATLASQRDDKNAVDRVNAVTQIAWNQFRDALSDLCDRQRIEAMQSGALRIQEIHNQAWHSLNHGGTRSNHVFQREVELLKLKADAWGYAITSTLDAVGNATDLRLRWLAILRDWNTLDQYVRLQRLERGLPWFDRVIDAVLQQELTADQHPLRPFFEEHETLRSADRSGARSNTMYGAWQTAESLARLGSQEAFDRLRSQHRDRFPTTRVDGYLQLVDQCAVRMGSLLYYLEVIDESGWPTENSSPVASE